MTNTYKKIILLFMFVAANLSAIQAQHARFIQSGSVTYEKRVNMHARLEELLDSRNQRNVYGAQLLDKYKSTNPQFKAYSYTYQFTPGGSTFMPAGKRMQGTWDYMEKDPAIDYLNTVYTDFKNQRTLTQKTIYNEVFAMADSLQALRWKLTDEHREIAGYDCRRANGLLMDSIYVVAFYTDQIPVSGGPESFHGLPGMILGLALPHDHITWFATEVIDKPVVLAVPEARKKDQPLTRVQFLEKIESIFGSQGSYFSILKRVLLL